MSESNIHHRRTIRLKGYDYSQAGLYFVTICVQNRQCLFGEIIGGKMVLNDLGKIAYDEWIKLSERYPHIMFDVFQIMPNHMHGIININNPTVGATLAVVLNNPVAPIGNPVGHIKAGASPAPTTVGNIVGAYKSLVANGCLKIYKQNNQTMWKLWQRNYYEHIIRNEQSYQRIAEYIINNPAKWNNDKFYAE